MSLPLAERVVPEGAARVGRLFSRVGELRGQLHGIADEADLAETLEEIELATIEVAETPAPMIDCCRQKAALLRERLVETLDPAVPGDAVTLALVASLLLDLARLSD